MAQFNADNDEFPLVKPRLRYADAESLRRGRGFSHGEISGAKASTQDVRMAGLPIDPMRRSTHDFNVKALKDLLGKSTGGVATPKKEGRAGKKQGRPQRKTKSAGSKAGKKK
jgi:hypothetical protein